MRHHEADPHHHLILDSPVGELTLITSATGLRAVLWPHDDTSRVKVPHSEPSNDHEILNQAAEELGRYFAAYHGLMEHWRSVMPGVIHTVVYEDLVADVEGVSRQLLEFCGLEWQQQCLTFYQSKEASTTASTVQVRKPVYSSSVGKWRQYRQQLAPLIQVLESAGIALDD